jgi:hypothetical protein
VKGVIRVFVMLACLAELASAQSDLSRYTGKVREFVWRNPKVYILFDVKEPDGTLQTYRLTCGSPSEAMRAGLRNNSVKKGDTLIVEVDADHSSRNFGLIMTTLPGGRKVRDCTLE